MSLGDYLKDSVLWHRRCAEVLTLGASIFGGTTTGTGGNYVSTMWVNFDRLTDGQLVRFRANHANPGATTFRWSGTAAKPLKTNTGAALSGGEIVPGASYSVQYHEAVDEWRLSALASPLVCEIERGVVQAIPSAVQTKILFNFSSHDLIGAADLANSRIVVPRNGFYFLYGFCSVEFVPADTQLQLQIRHNGSILRLAQIYSGSVTGNHTLERVHVGPLSAGAVLELYIYHTSGSDRNTGGNQYYRPRLGIVEIGRDL